MKLEQFPTYKVLSPVLKTQTTNLFLKPEGASPPFTSKTSSFTKLFMLAA